MKTKMTSSDRTTQGIRVIAEPFYMAHESSPDDGHYLFGYRMTIRNDSKTRVQLLNRYWKIIDAEGQSEEVHGEGVVGEQPTIEPGNSYQYTSYCPLATDWGTMEGYYEFQAEGKSLIQAAVGRFYLVAESAAVNA